MIYLKKTTETQNIYIPRQYVLGSAYVETVKDYEDGYNEGFTKGREYQKDQLLNLYVTENGEYNREDGYGVVTVDIPTEGGDCSDAYEEGITRGEQIQKSKLINLTVTENGIYEKEDGYKTITVDTPLDEAYDNGYADGYEDGLDNCPECPSISLENGSFTASENGEYTITPSEGFDGLESLNLTVNVEGSSCNLEDKWVYPSMADRDDNGLIVVEESEGYDGLSRVVIDPQTIYNEGVEEGRNQGGDCPELTTLDVTENGSYEGAFSLVNVDVPQEGGSCNLGILNMEATNIYLTHKYAADDGLDGYSEIIVRTENLINQEKENAINEFKYNMDEITITENGTYSIDDIELQHSITFDGNSYFDTGIVPTENIKIEACIKITEGFDAGLGGTIIGGGIDSINDSTENRGISIGMGGGAIYGKWGTLNSWNNPYDYKGTTTVVLQKTDDSFGWESEKGSFGASTLYIGGYNRNGEEVEEKFTQSIVYIKIWTNRNDDSTMTLFRPKNMAQGGFGLVNSEGTEYNYVENLGSGTTTFVEEWVNKYPNGFKRVEVNVDTQTFYNQGFADATSFNKIAMEIETDAVSKLEFLSDYSFVTTSGDNSPKSLMFDAPINYIWSYRDLFDGIAELRQNAFRSYGSIRKVKLNTIITLGERAFKDAYNLQEIDMSNLIGYIATEVFDGCSKLAKIICRATGSVLLGSAPFNGLPENGVLYLTEGIDEAPWLEKLPSGWTVERL